MSLFGIIGAAVKTVVSPVTDILQGDVTLSKTRESLGETVEEAVDTLIWK